MASGGNYILYCVQLIFKRERCGSKPDLVDRCCEMESHMTNDDLWVLDNNRREVEREVKQRLEERCDIVRWFEWLGGDGVHLSLEYCKRAAAYLCSRLTEEEEVVLRTERPPEKRQRRCVDGDDAEDREQHAQNKSEN